VFSPLSKSVARTSVELRITSAIAAGGTFNENWIFPTMSPVSCGMLIQVWIASRIINRGFQFASFFRQ
jgi:hypothetical protein